MVLTTRFKVLCVAAAAVGIYIAAAAPDSSSSAVVAAASQGDRLNAHPPAAAAALGSAVGVGGDGDLLTRLAHRVVRSKAVESLFRTQSWYVPPPPPPPAPVVEVKPPPPTAPPLPFGVMGHYARPGDATVYFLTRGDRVFDVRVGDTIDNTYSVDSATEDQLLLTYKPLNIQQALPLGGSP